MRIVKSVPLLLMCCTGNMALCQDQLSQAPTAVPWVAPTPWPFGTGKEDSVENCHKPVSPSVSHVETTEWLETQLNAHPESSKQTRNASQLPDITNWTSAFSWATVGNTDANRHGGTQPKPLAEWVVAASSQEPVAADDSIGTQSPGRSTGGYRLQPKQDNPRSSSGLIYTGASDFTKLPPSNLLALQLLRPLGEDVAPGDTSSKSPVKILPMEKAEKKTTSLTASGQLKTEHMIGPMTDASTLFSNLGTDPAPTGPTAEFVRTSNASLWASDVYTWRSPTFFHNPLYFEQPNLERYGIGTHRYLQPAASSIHFFSSIALMPYKVLTQHPCERVYTLGYDRPGNCAHFQGRPLLGQSRPGEIMKYWDCYSGY